MKILIYGFEPFGNNDSNITKEIIKHLPSSKDLIKDILPVEFNKEMILKMIKENHPDFIIGLGQHNRGKMIRIERKAHNVMKEADKLKPILNASARSHFLNLRLKKDKNSWLSYDAGDYVCNYSMYIISDYFKDIKFAFLHIPSDYSMDKAIGYIVRSIETIKKKYTGYNQKKLNGFLSSKD